MVSILAFQALAATQGSPPAVCTAALTPIPAIQGRGQQAAITGRVSVRGVVVGDFEGPSPALRGFYLQDAHGDGDPATSDAIFVFSGGNRDLVALGQVVAVFGTAGEFQGQTQISASTITVCGPVAAVTPVDIHLPFPDHGFAERYEGMLVRFPQTLYVTETFQLGRFGQVTLAAGGRLMQPTAVAAPGAAAAAVRTANELRSIVLDDAFNDQNPDPIGSGRSGQPLSASNSLRGGDSVTGLVGLLGYHWAGHEASGNTYRLRPLGALGGVVPEFVAENRRPDVPEVGGSVKVAFLNAQNYFITLGSRGAATETELGRQRAKLVAALLALGADVVGLSEIENGGAALADLVARLNLALGAEVYAAVTTGTIGTDEISVALIYRHDRLSLVGAHAILDDSFDPAFRDPLNRPVLAQSFDDRAGERFTVAVAHLKSKGDASGCERLFRDYDQGDGQGNCNATRAAAAAVLAGWLATDPTGSGDPDLLIIGDLNAYAKEDPLRLLEAAGYLGLQGTFHGAGSYTYVFGGEWGALDHALASESLLPQVLGAAAWHVNADEPNVLDYNVEFKSPRQLASLYAPDQFRFSDHDPLVVGLQLSGGR